ncbi:hypothetical protein EVAR_13796_1 [Eumeta japonica]|uniref:Mariner Mos1 transposase n=1 Tax=Eumeta variegata TaxID=151549 RepID=A0A4C1U1B3_EUMVA|nr:hypothetical protein EVAR_13796_1 [Eumeta japonica]
MSSEDQLANHAIPSVANAYHQGGQLSVEKSYVYRDFQKYWLDQRYWLERTKSITAVSHIQHSLPDVLHTLRVRGLMLHHDNGSSHIAALAVNFLKDNNIVVIERPLYSLDLAIRRDVTRRYISPADKDPPMYAPASNQNDWPEVGRCRGAATASRFFISLQRHARPLSHSRLDSSAPKPRPGGGRTADGRGRGGSDRDKSLRLDWRRPGCGGRTERARAMPARRDVFKPVCDELFLQQTVLKRHLFTKLITSDLTAVSRPLEIAAPARPAPPRRTPAAARALVVSPAGLGACADRRADDRRPDATPPSGADCVCSRRHNSPILLNPFPVQSAESSIVSFTTTLFSIHVSDLAVSSALLYSI